jgi:hypothetical protein
LRKLVASIPSSTRMSPARSTSPVAIFSQRCLVKDEGSIADDAGLKDEGGEALSLVPIRCLCMIVCIDVDGELRGWMKEFNLQLYWRQSGYLVFQY